MTDRSEIVSVSLPASLLREIDGLVHSAGYGSRSEAVQLALRGLLAEARTATLAGQHASAVVSVCFADRDERRVADVKHHHADIVRSMVHTHLEGEDCVEVFITSGRGERIESLVRGLRAIRGIHLVRAATIPKHGP